MKKAILAVLVVAMIPVASFASGFALYDANAKAMGMGSAFIGRADDASAVYYNPAGMAFLEGTNVLVNLTAIKPQSTVTLGNSYESEQRWVFAPSAYVTRKLTDDLALGFGMFVPNGLGMQWPWDYTGSFISYRSMSVGAFFRTALAYKVSDSLSVAAGVDYVYSKLLLWRHFPYAMMGIPMNLFADERAEGSGSGVGFVASALYKGDKFQFGLKYRHSVEIDYEGDSDMTVYESGNPMIDGQMNMIFKDQEMSTSMTIPAELSAGVMVKANDRLSFTGDFSYTFWNVIDEITLVHSDAMTQAMLGENDVWHMNWEDTWFLRLGTEYWLNDEFAVRAGLGLDNTPIPADTLTPFAPDGDRKEVTFGLGYDTKESCCWGRFFTDVAYRYLVIDDGESEFEHYPAEFTESYAHLISISAGFQF